MATIEEALRIAAELRRGGQEQQAERIYRQIVAADPTRVAAWQHLIEMLGERGSLADALQCCRQAVAHAPALDPRILNRLGSQFYQQRSLSEAVEAYGLALQIQPNYAVAAYNRGNVLRILGQRDAAVAHYQQAL